MQNGLKHILILSSWYPNKKNPFLGNFVQRQAVLLAKKFQVTVLFIVADSEIEDTEWSIAERNNLKEIVIYHPKGTNFFSRRHEQDKAFEAGLKIIHDVDLIHAHVLLPKGYLFVKAKKTYNCPLLVTEHASYYRPEKRKKWTLKERFILNNSKKHIDKLIAVSDFLKIDLANYFQEHTIITLSNPINTNLFVPQTKAESKHKNFLHISTLDKETKNPKGIFDAIILLRDKGYFDFTLTVISDEPTDEWKAFVIDQKIQDLIIFAGPLQPEELVPYYQKCDSFILFSCYETFSIVLAEAWACGIPTISTPVGIGLNLSPELGIQIKINDTLSLAIAMEKIINGQQFDSDAIRKKALNYSDEYILDQLSTVYKQFNG
jgi:glycosyltransferase involved in cell wall biosynthesis